MAKEKAIPLSERWNDEPEAFQFVDSAPNNENIQNKDTAMKYTYPACFYPDANEHYTVIFPDFGRVTNHGDNLEDAIINATDWLSAWVLECKRHNKQLPEPSNIISVGLDDMEFDGVEASAHLIVANIGYGQE